jgi:hypothetical protein
MRLRQRTEQSEMGPVDGEAKTDHRKAGKDSDEHAKDEEK